MEPRNPDYVQQVEELFRQAAFVMDVGYELVGVTPPDTYRIVSPYASAYEILQLFEEAAARGRHYRRCW